MTTNWFYEYDGKKIGPVPAATLRHLAAHGAVTPATNVWQGDMETPVLASRLTNLFPEIVEASVVSGFESNETVRGYLTEALNACRDEDEERLNSHVPSISAIHPFAISGILLDFEILNITKLPPPIHDPSLPPEERTKPVRLLFEATVHVVLCDRPNYRASLAEVRRLQVGRREETVVYECKEFKDGDWIFLDASLTR